MAQIPLDTEAFFGTFAAYHQSFRAAPLIWLALALIVVYLAAATRGRSDRMVGLFLAAVWAWAGIAYHFMSLAPVNPAGYLFGTLFVAQGLVFLHVGVVRNRLVFAPTRDVYGVAGAVLIAYALVLYPIIGLVLGHRFPAMPAFGVPCPTTIFTFGILLWTTGRVPGWVLVIPLMWAFIGATAALNWGVWQDLAMPAAAMIASAMIVARNRRNPVSAEEQIEREEMAALAGLG
jgi:hypothetical protein